MRKTSSWMGLYGIKEHTLIRVECSSPTYCNYRIRFKETLLDRTGNYHPLFFREAIEIHKHPNTFNGEEEGVSLTEIWTQALRRTKTLSYREKLTNQLETRTFKATLTNNLK